MTDAVNLGVVGMTFPDISVLKIGPWIGVDKGETHYAKHLSSANRPDFWDLDSDPRPIAHHQDVIFLVAMCENDGSSPDTIRGGVRTDMLAARATNTNRTYDAYVTAMISIMTGSIETTRILGLDPLNLNEDDLFETVKPLALNASDIDRLNNDLLPVVKTLRFTQRRGNGNVDQRLHRHVLVHGLNVSGSGDGTAASQSLRSEIVTTTSRAVDSKGSAELFERARDFRRRLELMGCYRP